MSPQIRWDVPSPYNYAAAIDGVGTISAPLLAGISIALTAIVISGGSAFGLASLTLGCLVFAAGAFVACVECVATARQYVVTPSDLESWWPDYNEPMRCEMLQREQRAYHLRFQTWADRARWGYDLGVLALSLGVVTLLVPHGHVSGGRWTVIALAALGFACEFLWIVKTHCTQPTLDVSSES